MKQAIDKQSLLLWAVIVTLIALTAFSPDSLAGPLVPPIGPP
jgi:hypothetical protein